MKRKNVIMTVTGRAQADGMPDDVIRLFTTGHLSGEDKSWRLRYTETDPETSEKSRITLTIQDKSIRMAREGSQSTLMEFTSGQRFEGIYQTPYGEMSIGVFPSEVSYHIGEADGEINLSYQLDIQGQHAGRRELHIRFADKASARS